MKKRWRLWNSIQVSRLLVATGTVLIIASASRMHVNGQDGQLASGPWLGEANYSLDGISYSTTIQFTVDGSGQVTDGAILLYFTFPDIPVDVLALMQQHGCAVSFTQLNSNSRPVAGLFASSTEGLGIFNAESCTLEGFGALQFVTPVAGTWNAVAQNPAGMADEAAPTVSPYDPPTHPNDGLTGRELYNLHCEECHAQRGLGSAGAPPLEGLNAIKIASTVRDGPEDMDVFTHEELPDRQLNALIDYVLKFHPDSTPRTEFVITPPTTE